MMRLLRFVLLPSAVMANQSAHKREARRSLRPEHIPNDHNYSITIVDDDGIVDDDHNKHDVNVALKQHIHKGRDKSSEKDVDEDNDNSKDKTKGDNDKEANNGPLKLFDHVSFSVGSHFKGWEGLTSEEQHKISNDVDLQFVDNGDDVEDTIDEEMGDNLIQNEMEFPNNRFCGYTFDDAVDTHCRTPVSCQFTRCPEGMVCYVLSEGVMSWCDAEDDNGDSVANGEEIEQHEMKSSEPSENWSEMPIERPSHEPTFFSASPSEQPSMDPSFSPTVNPTMAPSNGSTNIPSTSPSIKPTKLPTVNPTTSPTDDPSFSPTWSPTFTPSINPTLDPVTAAPTTDEPTAKPTIEPPFSPTEKPSEVPTIQPSKAPVTLKPTEAPSTSPSSEPSEAPTSLEPTESPSFGPTLTPSMIPTSNPVTVSPADTPTYSPTEVSREDPTKNPSPFPMTSAPNKQPTLKPTDAPSTSSSLMTTFVSAEFTTSGSSTDAPMKSPTRKPSQMPTKQPSGSPTSNPFQVPTETPDTKVPTVYPTFHPSSLELSSVSSAEPSIEASDDPSNSESDSPSHIPSVSATLLLSNAPTQSPPNGSTLKPIESVNTSTPSPVENTNPEISSPQPSSKDLTSSPNTIPMESKNTNKPSQENQMATPQSGVVTPSPPAMSSVALNTQAPNLVRPAPSATPHNIVTLTPAPTFVIGTSESAEPTSNKEAFEVGFPNLNYVLLTTEGNLSREAVENVESAVDSFLTAELTTYYKNNFDALSIRASDVQPVTRDLERRKTTENRIRRRQLPESTGTEIVFEGVIKFVGSTPDNSDLSDALIFLGQESNEYLVSNITSTGNSELQDVTVVFVEYPMIETYIPSSSPSTWVEEFERSPDGINEPVETTPPTEARTSIIIVSICGIAALTMLLFVFATRSRTFVEDQVEDDIRSPPKISGYPQNALPSEIDVESAEASYAKSSQQSPDETESGYYLNDNEASTIISSVTDWNDYATVDSRKVTTKSRVEIVNGSRSHEDIVATLFTPDGKRKTAAELNVIGTRTLEKNDQNVVPKSWDLTASGEYVPSRFSLGAATESSTQRGEESDTDDYSTDNDGGFPRLSGSFPTASHTHVNSKDFPTSGTSCGAEAIYHDLDSSIDHSAISAFSTVGSGYDWSHIGTVADAVSPECAESSSDSQTARDSTSGPAGVPSIAPALSQDTKDTTSSLNRFINDLVWLEKKITDENDAAKVREAVELTLQESDIQNADSYSYQCESFSPRSNSSIDEDSTTISSRQASLPMSIVCKDCYMPPGEFRIDIVSTVDGPMINGVDAKLNGHLGGGDLIIAVDDNDSRALSAEEVHRMIMSRSDLERKLTVLQFGGTTSIC